MCVWIYHFSKGEIPKVLVTKLENAVDVRWAEAFVDLRADIRRCSLDEYTARVAGDWY